MQTESRKLAPQFMGPFQVAWIVKPAVVHLKLPASLNTLPTFHVLWVKLVREFESLRIPPTPPPAHVIDGAPAYMAKRILDRGCGWQYFIDWEEYGPEEQLWVSHRHILDQELLWELYRGHPDKPGRAPGAAF